MSTFPVTNMHVWPHKVRPTCACGTCAMPTAAQRSQPWRAEAARTQPWRFCKGVSCGYNVSVTLPYLYAICMHSSGGFDDPSSDSTHQWGDWREVSLEL